MAARRQTGFTLVEVMVALVVVALGLSAVIAVASRSIDNAYTFRERALAMYIGMNVITEMRLGGEFPEVGDDSDNLDFGTREWVYTATVSDTGIDTLRRVEVEVALREVPDATIRTVTGFVGKPIPGKGAAANQAWGQSVGVVE